MDLEPTSHSSRTVTTGARDSAVEQLLTALEQVVQRYRGADACERRGAEAERITAEVARRLCVARTRLAATVVPPGGPGTPSA